MIPVSIELTLLLFFLILNFLGSDLYLIIAVCTFHQRSVYEQNGFLNYQYLRSFHKILRRSLTSFWNDASGGSSWRSFSGLYFPAFALNTEIYRVNLHSQFECRKIRIRKLRIWVHSESLISESQTKWVNTKLTTELSPITQDVKWNSV